MIGCGDQWCHYPWDWMVTHILLKMAIFGAEGGFAGSPVEDCIG